MKPVQPLRLRLPETRRSQTATSYCLDYTSASTPEELESLFDPFWESWKLLHENYVDQPLDDVILMRGAIQGMLAATGDKHTSYMDPEQFKQANTEMEGEYTGIGAWVNTGGDYVEIISPMKGSPAEAAGLQAQDLVIAINGEDDQDPWNLVLKDFGSRRRNDRSDHPARRGTFDVPITRALIKSVVDYEMREDGIGYVALYTFNGLATEKLRAALKDILAQKPKGIVFDLRGNGGGYLVTAVRSDFGIPQRRRGALRGIWRRHARALSGGEGRKSYRNPAGCAH